MYLKVSVSVRKYEFPFLLSSGQDSNPEFLFVCFFIFYLGVGAGVEGVGGGKGGEGCRPVERVCRVLMPGSIDTYITSYGLNIGIGDQDLNVTCKRNSFLGMLGLRWLFYSFEKEP